MQLHFVEYTYLMVPLSMGSLENFHKLPSLLILLDDLIKILFLKHFRQIPARLLDLNQALTSPSKSPLFNYEPLETLGDSLLKVITSMFVYSAHPR